MKYQMSMYEGVYNWDTPTISITGRKLFEMVRSTEGTLARLTKNIQSNYSLKGTPEYKKLKAHLPKVVPGLKGEKSRASKDIKESDLTGLITLDVDHQDQAKELKEWFSSRNYEELSYIYMAFRSISGVHDGSLCVIVQVAEELYTKLVAKANNTLKKAIAEKFFNDTGLIAKTVNGITQARYLAHDPSIYYRPSPAPITAAELPEIKLPNRNNRITSSTFRKPRNGLALQVQTPVGEYCDPQFIMDWAFQRASVEETPGKGSTHSFLGKWVPLIYKCGVSVADAITYANYRFPTKDNDHNMNITDFYFSLAGTQTNMVPFVDSLTEIEYITHRSKDNYNIVPEGSYLEVDDSFFQYKRLIIEADTGIGKTHGFMDYAKRKNIPMVLIQPYRSAAEQKGSEWNWHTIVSGVSPNGDKRQVGTFNAISKIDLTDEIDLSNTVLVVDECHTLVTEAYRKDTMHELFNSFSRFKSVILITATFIESPLFKDFPILRYKREDQHTEVKLIEADSPQKALVDTLEKNCLNFVLLDDKTQQGIMAKFLEEKGLNTVVLNREAKESEIYKDIIKEKEVPADINVLITTRVLTHAVNMFAPGRRIKYIVISNMKGPVLPEPYQIIQFANRFRKHDTEGVTVIVKRTAKPYYFNRGFHKQGFWNQISLKASNNVTSSNTLMANITDDSQLGRLTSVLSEEKTLYFNKDFYAFEESQVGIAQAVYESETQFNYYNFLPFYDYLASHQFFVSNVQEHTKSFSREDEKRCNRIKQELNKEKAQTYKSEIIEAFEAYRNGDFSTKETVGGFHFRKLNSLLDNAVWARDILLSNKKRNFNKIIRLAEIEYRKMQNTLHYYERKLLSCIEVGEIYSSDEFNSIIDSIIKYAPRSEILLTDKQIPKTQKERLIFLNGYFIRKRTSSRKKKNCWKIISDAPLRKYHKKWDSAKVA